MSEARATIQVRVSKEEKTLLEALAEKQGVTLSDFLRCIYRQFLDKSLVKTGGNVYVVPKPTNITDIDFTQANDREAKTWCNIVYQTSMEKKKSLAELAEKRGITLNMFAKELVMDWLAARQSGEALGTIEIPKRPRGAVGNTERIYMQFTLQEKQELKRELGSAGRTMPALIDTLIDTYAKSQHDEPKGEQKP
jgi:hypothetical protein